MKSQNYVLLCTTQRVLRDYRKVERRLLTRVAERDAALEAAAADRLNGGLLGRAQARARTCFALCRLGARQLTAPAGHAGAVNAITWWVFACTLVYAVKLHWMPWL